MTQPLSGIKVVDLTHAIAGPFCTYHLALMGADIIKVEPPNGDEFRVMPAIFHACDPGKKSMTLNLKTDKGREILLKMVRDADVLIENYRPGVAEELGLDWPTLKSLNPKLIYVSVSGFGQDGPMKSVPAIEFSVQAATGLMESQLRTDSSPRETGMLMLDPLTAYTAYSSILAALLLREKTGEGQRLDVAMIDAAMMISSIPIARAQLEERGQPAPPAGGRPTVTRVMASDRELFIAAVQPVWWERVCEVIGKPEMISDPRFASAVDRQQNADALKAEWEAGFAGQPAEHWETALNVRGVPAAVVRTIIEFARHPHVTGRGGLSAVQVPGQVEPLQLMGAGVQFETGGPVAPGDVPELDAHTDEVLMELGFNHTEIAELRQQGVAGKREGLKNKLQ